MKLRLAIGSAVLLAIAFVVNTAFLRSALIDGYQVSEIKHYLIPMDLSSNVIGKSLGDNDRRLSINEMRDILERERQAIDRRWQQRPGAVRGDGTLPGEGLVNLSIILKSGSKLVTTADGKADRITPPALVEQIRDIANGGSGAGLDFVEDNRYYYVPHLLVDDQGRWIVSLIFQFRKQALKQAVAPMLAEHTVPTIGVVAFCVFGILFLYFQLAFRKRVTRKKEFVFDFLSIMLASLLCSLLVNAVIFESQILEASVSNARATTAEISARLNQRLESKMAGEQGEKERFGFSESFARFDNFEAIILTTPSGKPVYRRQDGSGQYSGLEAVVQTAVIGRLPDNQFQVAQKLTGSSLEKVSAGTAVIHISKQDIFRSWMSLLINGVTILFITALMMVECLLLYLHLLAKKKFAKRGKGRYELGFVRPAMFLFLFAIDLSMSILPLHMQSFEAELFGMSRDIVLGLPISAEFLCVGIFILIAGVWVDRRGWHQPFFAGLLVVMAGSLWSWLAADALTFIFARALVGVGYGLSLMSAQGLVVAYGGVNGRARGFASLFAGLYSGSICGAAAGAFFAERLGYEKVFFLGAVIVLALIAFSWNFMRPLIEPVARKPAAQASSARSVRLGPLLRFIGNPVFIALSVLSSLPASIAVAGFLHFFTPVFLDQIGARESTIGQVLILYGICLIYFGPSIGRLIDRSQNKKYYMLAGGLLGGLAFAIFDTSLGIAAVVLSVFLLGLSSSFVLSSQSTMVLELKESRELGEGTALGIFRSISRIGQVIGPMIFGWVLLTGNLTEVINRLGYSYIAAMLILAVFVIKHTGKLENRKPALSK